MIYYDIDGVVRHLDGHFGVTRTKWDMKVDGKGFVDAVNENLGILEEAEPLPYMDIVHALEEAPTFLTVQPANWKPYTIRWLKRNAPFLSEVIFVKAFEDKIRLLQDGDLLVDDYPFFSDYSKVILVDWPYNRHVKAPFARVKSSDELFEILKEAV